MPSSRSLYLSTFWTKMTLTELFCLVTSTFQFHLSLLISFSLVDRNWDKHAGRKADQIFVPLYTFWTKMTLTGLFCLVTSTFQFHLSLLISFSLVDRNRDKYAGREADQVSGLAENTSAFPLPGPNFTGQCWDTSTGFRRAPHRRYAYIYLPPHHQIFWCVNDRLASMENLSFQ
jgi:hypothetical protein